MNYPLSDYIEAAMKQAVYDKADDGTYTGEIEICPGVYSFEATLEKCRSQLRSVLEGWILLGLQLRHPLPVIGGIDLNSKERIESLAAM